MISLNNPLQDGFRLHDCVVYPSRNVVKTGGGEQHLEPKVMQVLLVLAATPGEVVSREALLEKVWPDTYSGDAALSRCVSLLRTYLGEQKGNRQFIETVAKTGYRLVAPLEAGEPNNRHATISGSTRRQPWKTPLASIALVAVLVSALAWHWSEREGSDEPQFAVRENQGIHTVAVMPFANLSGDPANEYLSDGVSEEILNVLAQMPGLRVTSRSSSFSYRNTDIPVSEVAKQLGVDSLLEGSVRKFDDQIRISVQLIEPRSEMALWSKSYDRLFDDVLLIQEEIARAVATTLLASLDVEDPPERHADPTRLAFRSADAYQAFLRGRFLAAQRTRSSLEDALLEFQKVLADQPDQAATLSELAITYLLLAEGQYGELNAAEAMDQAESMAARAVELDPDLAEAHAASGQVAWRKGRSSLAEQHFERALEINPNYAIVYHWLSMLMYRNLGEHQAAFRASAMARMLDPVSAQIASIYTQMLMSRGRTDEAAAEIEKLRAISPVVSRYLRGELDSLQGRWASTIIGHLDALLIDPDLGRGWNVLRLGLARLGLAEEVTAIDKPLNTSMLMDLGRTDEALEYAGERYRADPESARATRMYSEALIFAGRGEEALPLLERLWEMSDHRVALVSSHFFLLQHAVSLHQLRKMRGDDAGAREVLVAIGEEIERAREAGVYVTRRGSSLDFSEGLMLYLAGDRQAGLESITKALRDGFDIRERMPYFALLSSDPEFDRLMQIQEGHRQRELQRLLSIVCHENPYATIWQPRDETCTLPGALGSEDALGSE
jgi:TolB-like protein/DNA-binding winged helix-turn-helix (wHTH) protein/Tfp pilus assembly protein PilF